MPLNLRSGFNRIFVVAWAGWAAYCLIVFPLQKRREIATKSEEEIKWCLSGDPATQDNPHPYIPTYEESKLCYDTSLEMRTAELDAYSIRNYYLSGSLLLGVAIVLFPLIAYAMLVGLFWGSRRTFIWIRRGFTAK